MGTRISSSRLSHMPSYMHVSLPPRPQCTDTVSEASSYSENSQQQQQTVEVLQTFTGVHAQDSPDAEHKRDTARLSIEPMHALIVMGVLIIALATSLTLLVQQSINLSAEEQNASTSTASSPVTASSSASSSATCQESTSLPVESEEHTSTQQLEPTDQVNEQQQPTQATSNLIDLNTATQSELETIKGVGPVTAANIIAYRTTIGRFTSVDDLINVDGIGTKTLEKIRPQVEVR